MATFDDALRAVTRDVKRPGSFERSMDDQTHVPRSTKNRPGAAVRIVSLVCGVAILVYVLKRGYRGSTSRRPTESSSDALSQDPLFTPF